MNDPIPKPEIVQERYRSIEYKASKSKAFDIMQVLLILVVISPITLIFGALFAFIFLDSMGIHFQFGSVITTLFITYFSMILAFLFYYYFFIIVLIVITLVTYKRTNYKGYLYESLIELQILLVPVVVLLIWLFVTHSPFTVFFFIFPIMLEYKLIKKPLIYGSNYANSGLSRSTITSESADIISSQSVYVNNFEDGYSSRPVVESIHDIILQDNFPTIKEKLHQFANFLCENGDLVGIDIDDTKLKMYLRTRFIQKKQIFNPLVTFRKAKLLLKKVDLTTVIIDFETLEISFKLNKYDYDYLGNITYYQLSERILNQFKVGIKEFFANNYEDSYKEINPDNKINNSSYVLRDGPQAFLVIGYIVSCFILGPITYFITISNGVWLSFDPISFLIGNIIGWPLFLYFYLNNTSYQYSTNPFLLFQERFILIITILAGALISLILTILIYKYLRERALRLQGIRKRKIKMIW